MNSRSSDSKFAHTLQIDLATLLLLTMVLGTSVSIGGYDSVTSRVAPLKESLSFERASREQARSARVQHRQTSVVPIPRDRSLGT